MGVRRIFMRSLSGNALGVCVGSVVFSDIVLLLAAQLSAQLHQFGFLRSQLGPNLLKLFLLVQSEMLE